MDLTDKGKEELREYGFSRSLRHGGIEHLYWIKQVKVRLESKGYKVKEEFPIGNGETIDLVVGKNVAVEIETGKSDALRNIRKCLEAGFEVVSVATNGEALEKTESRLGNFSECEMQKIRAAVVWKGRDPKQECN